jgi:putative ATP-dependent endonuclease of OLD family
MSAIPKIERLEIKNFGCIGNDSITLDIDKIVILVGPNNAGKSTILRAYEAVTDAIKLTQDDFHNKQIVDGNFPEITLCSIATSENKPGDEWCKKLDDDTFRVTERWTWTGAGVEPVRIGFNVELDRWATKDDKEKMPWGSTNVAKARRPKPHRVNTFDDPDIQTKGIISLLKSLLEDEIKTIKKNDGDEISIYNRLLDDLKKLRDDSKNLQTANINALQASANEIIGKIFPKDGLKICAPLSTAAIKVDLLGDEFSLEMGAVDGVTFPLEKQGSGSRRTALWTILKLLADKGISAKTASAKAKSFHESLGPNTAHILLLDEPEVSLHPLATSMARDVLYSLPDNDNWQIMIATHSPSFIDLTKDNTTIIRVDKVGTGSIKTTTLFRPSIAKLDSDDKSNLKLTNLFDSHISEAFFGGRVIVVEGDTEYSAFNHVKAMECEKGNFEYQDLNIIRARGKVTVASMMKVLNHFKMTYYVLHDTDRPRIITKRLNKSESINGRKVYDQVEVTNPAWTNNVKIISQMNENSRVVASVTNFEDAYFDETVGSDKPENCINHLKEEQGIYAKIKNLLDGILELEESALPEGAIVYKSIDELKNHVESYLGGIKLSKHIMSEL